MKYFTKREDVLNVLLSILLVLILIAIAIQRYIIKQTKGLNGEEAF